MGAKAFKIDLPESRAKQLIQSFDTNQDGALQLDEFLGIDAMRNKLEALMRDERNEVRQRAKEERDQAEAAEMAERRMELVNDKAPTTTDKVVSVLPYLFPLLDGLAFSRFFV